MIDILYNIFIFPLVQIIEISFVVVHSIFRNNILAIIGVSAVVSICTTPLYIIAEKQQNTERDIQSKLRNKIKKIKSVFSGDEQYMLLSAYYRQNHYHPIYALRSSIGIIVQIPFFIAAYSWLSNLDYFNGTSFLFIRDLGMPDRFLPFGRFSFNILPILMTLINCLSGAIYAKNLQFRDKIQIYGMAFVFFFLLYNSMSVLVLYWTINNIFSLFKNLIIKSKYKIKVIYILLCLFSVIIDIRFITLGFSPKRLLVASLCSSVFFAPLFIKLFNYIKIIINKSINLRESSLSVNSTFILSGLILFILAGIVIPASLIASSVQEFSFLETYTSPLPFIFNVLLQAAGFFLFWPLCIYLLYSGKIRYRLTLIFSLICVTVLANNFLFSVDYGFFTTTFKFSNPDTLESKYIIIALNTLISLLILGIFIFLLLDKRRFIFHSFQLIVLTALTFYSIITIYKINTDFKNYAAARENSFTDSALEIKPVYRFSKNGKNIVILMLDAAISGYVSYIFEERPELLNDFSGFTYYPNCISFGNHTRIGAPLVFGGYEYEPRLIQKNRSYTMARHNEALLMLPRLFLDEGYNVTVTDPSFANYSLKPDLSIFASYPEISVRNIQGNYTGIWLRSNPELNIVSVPELLKQLLIRFSFFKMTSPAFRVFIYDKAQWLKPGGNLLNNQLSLDTIDCYTTLDYLPQLTEISDDSVDTYTSMVNDLAHDFSLFQYPDYTPAMNITNFGNSSFAYDAVYHSNIAAFLLIGKWLKFLQEQGVYNNMRIIIASDHGNKGSDYSGNIKLLNGDFLSRYHALLFVKDFNSQGEYITDDSFMTHGDVPSIAMNDIIKNPINPFSGNPVTYHRENNAVITTSNALQYTISDNQWLFVHDNIFDPKNWEKVEK